MSPFLRKLLPQQDFNVTKLYSSTKIAQFKQHNKKTELQHLRFEINVKVPIYWLLSTNFNISLKYKSFVNI